MISVISEKNKNKILLISGISDSLLSSKGNKGRGKIVASNIALFIEEHGHRYDTFISLNEGRSSRIIEGNSHNAKRVNINTCTNGNGGSKNLLSGRSEMYLNDPTGNAGYTVPGVWVPHVMRPSEYSIFVAGIDLNKMMIDTIQFLVEEGYSVNVINSLFLTSSSGSEKLRRMDVRPFRYTSPNGGSLHRKKPERPVSR